MIRKSVLALLLCLATVAAQAQLVISKSNKSVTGVVSGIDGARILLFDNRLAVDTTGATIRSDFGPASLADIAAGTRITASVTYGKPDGTLVAVAVQILSIPDAALSGPIEAVDLNASTVQIAGQKVLVTAQTVIRRTNDASPAPLTALRAMQLATIELDRGQPGLVAKSIAFAHAIVSGSMGGTVRAIDGDKWTIAGGPNVLVLKVTAETALIGGPKVGDHVVATYHTDANGDLVATSIARMTSVDEGDVAGNVVSLTDSAITLDVNGTHVSIAVNEHTVYRPGKPNAGDLVVVRTQPDASGAPVATSVEAIAATHNSFVFDGTITKMERSRWTIQGVTVIIAPTTKLVGSPKLGDRVHVVATGVNNNWIGLLISKL